MPNAFHPRELRATTAAGHDEFKWTVASRAPSVQGTTAGRQLKKAEPKPAKSSMQTVEKEEVRGLFG